MMVAVTRNALIVLAMILSPFWLAWVCGGMLADKIGQNRRSPEMMKGDRK